MTGIIDISPTITEDIAVWPGDVSFSRSIQADIASGANIRLSSFNATVHLGAHADAPNHYHRDGASIDRVALDPYIGPCEVITVKTRTQLIGPEHCEAALKRGAKRLLFKTLSQPDAKKFNTDFVAFSAAAMQVMGEAGVLLVGIDTASVDPFDSKDLPAHQQLYKYSIRNLEGLVLAHVPDGAYELIALPLKLAGFDASPVRAILRPLPV